MAIMTGIRYFSAVVPPSVIQIRDGESVVKEWTVEQSDDEAANAKLGAEVAWNVRLAYGRPWEI
jgi:hypothetical protein